VLPNPVGTRSAPLPPILLGEFMVNPKKKRQSAVYGHLDVQPASKRGWMGYNPFVLWKKTRVAVWPQ
jgi:acetylornithine deacetylase/succinyl-diaminopimelate desuccinylase-like protein